jgi:hypothetical protein
MLMNEEFAGDPIEKPVPAPVADERPEFRPVAHEPPLIRRQREVLAELVRLVADRARGEPREEGGFKSGNEAAQDRFENACQSLSTQFAAKKEALEREQQSGLEGITTRYETQRAATEKEFAEVRERILDHYEEAKQTAKAESQEACWTISAIFDGIKTGLERQLNESQGAIAEATQKIAAIRGEAKELLQKCRLYRESATDKVRGSGSSDDRFAELKRCVADADAQLATLRHLKIPHCFKGERLLWFFVGMWLVLSLCSALVARVAWGTEGLWTWVYGLAGGAACVLVVGLPALWLLYLMAKRQVDNIYRPICEALAEAETLLGGCQDQALMSYHSQLGEAKRRQDKDLREAGDKYKQLRMEMKARCQKEVQQTVERYRRVRAENKKIRERDLTAATERYRQARAELEQQYERVSRQVHDTYGRQMEEAKLAYEKGWNLLVTNWQQGLAGVHAAVEEVNLESNGLFPDWTDPCWKDWSPAVDIPPALPIGNYQVSLEQLPGGLPRDERLKPQVPTTFSLPALLAFPDQCSVLFKAKDDGRLQAVQALQAIMFRLLTTIPPGKVRFTIIDPVGLGQNFASFMHLADYDEALVTSRIWTEVPHIEQRLADLTGHMENVIQKYLRNQFETLEEYNTHAGEVAEPYRILVVANFPANFSTEASRRLVSIVNSGPRCGVYTLISVDAKQALPQGFNLMDLLRGHVNLAWDGKRFVWHDADFERYPLQLEAPPPTEFGTRLLRIVGESAKEAKRVEVPFEFVAPTRDRWWTGDSRLGINVPLGRVGATKRQHLRLGLGTSQHVLIAGKTGSGKSTLLHALISNLALLYSPEEIELYLIDFKKGVEFKTYASHELPHARVVAIESEREFGLSVLQRLDAELRQRGERFRELGAQDLNSYRQANGNKPLPRILLIVDEFQEFFVEDDKIAQDAALLLDRLVRQGRAFGLHVLLGSQTLGGAYTLARSTIDQMAVRIALQCSEADGHIILSDDNSAARLLSRPGEAIYNDANGLVEGNNPFQIVWLPDERREDYLEGIQELARQRRFLPPHAQIVFEGNAPADVGKNDLLQRLLSAPNWPASTKSGQAWLGESIAIKDATAAVFRSQSGSNLLIVGQNDEAALGIMATALIGLSAQHAPPARFSILDGCPDDSPLAGMLARVAAVLPQQVQVVGRRELTASMTELAEEVERRHQLNETDAPPCYLFVYGLQRFRELRRQEDDFSFSRRADDAPPDPAKQFANILREGPAVRVHTVVWCDNLNNVNRTLERQALREFELRVLFQMSATDSANLIDTPLASKLGLHRALFHSEEQGRMEKFRPYGIPPAGWLEQVREQLNKKCMAVVT